MNRLFLKKLKPALYSLLQVENPWYNAIWYTAVWWSAVLGRDKMLWLTLALLVLHCVRVISLKRELFIILPITLTGITVDLCLGLAGVFQFENNAIIPLWLCCLWFAFAATLLRSMKYFLAWPWLAVVFGSIGGTLSYFGGYGLGAVGFGYSGSTVFIVLLVLWALLFPALLYSAQGLAKYLDKKECG